MSANNGSKNGKPTVHRPRYEKITIRRTPDTPGDLMGTLEAATELCISRPTVERWVKRGYLAPPVAKLGSGPVYLRKDVMSAGRRAKQRAVREAKKAAVAAKA